MNLSPHFTLEEFTASDMAIRRKIDNTLPDDLVFAAHNTAQMMENIRELLGFPIKITSGYRSPELNRAIGSNDTSDHIKAQAVDFTCKLYGTPYDVCCALRGHLDGLGIGQLIYEYGSWVHVSTRQPSKIINRVITIDNNGTRVGIQMTDAIAKVCMLLAAVLAIFIVGYSYGDSVASAKCAEKNVQRMNEESEIIARAVKQNEAEAAAQRQAAKKIRQNYDDELSKIRDDLAGANRLRVSDTICRDFASATKTGGSGDANVAGTRSLPTAVERNLRALMQEADEIVAGCRASQEFILLNN